MRKSTIWFPNRSDGNRAVEVQLTILDLESKRIAKTKAPISYTVNYCEAYLHLCFRIWEMQVFT